jgi:ribonuclease-3
MLEELQQQIKYNFKNEALLKTALTTPSYATKRKCESYQKFEYLGDSVLKTCVLHFLSDKYPEASNGDITLKYNNIVNNERLGEWALLCGIDRYVFTLSEKVTVKTAADIFEALCGAMFKDSHYDFNLVTETLIIPLIEWVETLSKFTSSKFRVIDAYQKKFGKTPTISVSYTGSPSKYGVSSVAINEFVFMTDIKNEHSSKKNAEKAAFDALHDFFISAINSR